MKHLGVPVMLSILALLCPLAPTPVFADASVAVATIMSPASRPVTLIEPLKFPLASAVSVANAALEP